MRKIRSIFGLIGVGLLVVMMFERPAAGLNTQLLRPSTGHVKGYQLFTSETLPKYYLATGLNINYAHHPFELILAGTTSRVLGIVDRFVTADFLVSYGLTDWWTLNVDMPLNIYHDIAPTFIATRDQGGGDPGDLGVNMKFRIFDADKTSTGLGLAIVPFLTVPTGRQSVWFGDENLTGGGMLVGDAQWKSNRFYLNVGGRVREKEQVTSLIVNEELLYGLGFTRPLVKDWDFNIIVELFGATNFRKFATENISSPVEGLAILQKKWGENRNLITHVGGGVGVTNGYGVPTWRALVGVSYAWDLEPEKKPVREEVIMTNQIHFAFDKADIKPSSFPIVDEIVATVKSRPEIRHVTIEGHTDSKGSDEYNLNLSNRRAGAVREYLVNHGIPSSQLSSVGKGESEPIAPNDSNGKDNPKGRALNRRVEFHLEIVEGAKLKVIESQQPSPT